MQSLEDIVDKNNAATSFSVSNCAEKLAKRNKRRKNIMIFGVQESSDTNLCLKITNKINAAGACIQRVGIKLPRDL